MPKKLQKSLQDYLYKIKNPTQNVQSSSHSLSKSKKWVLRGCKHPKTLSFSIARNQDESHNEEGEINKGSAATLSDVDRFLYENFSSLYINDDDGNYHKESDHISRGGDQAPKPDEILTNSPRHVDPPLDLCGTHRFFLAPGSSSSLVEEAPSSLAATSENLGSTSTSSNCCNNLNDDSATVASNDIKQVRLPDDCIAVLTYSPSPYDDFRQSMQEMVEEKLQNSGKVDWDFMEELLLCYLNLNEKTSHKFILGAFVDLIVGLRKNPDKIPVRSRHSRTARSGRRKKFKNVT